ncbi:hypothetical protein GLYMA_05G114200v4 [Glycine max]|nr:hypothetical protein GLYMA_05G114200v4 [Glycine max]KAH1133891.1 hypothetical protein GYH30_012341 [Glycine max]
MVGDILVLVNSRMSPAQGGYGTYMLIFQQPLDMQHLVLLLCMTILAQFMEVVVESFLARNQHEQKSRKQKHEVISSSLFARLEKVIHFNYFWTRCTKLIIVSRFQKNMDWCSVPKFQRRKSLGQICHCNILVHCHCYYHWLWGFTQERCCLI